MRSRHRTRYRRDDCFGTRARLAALSSSASLYIHIYIYLNEAKPWPSSADMVHIKALMVSTILSGMTSAGLAPSTYANATTSSASVEHAGLNPLERQLIPFIPKFFSRPGRTSSSSVENIHTAYPDYRKGTSAVYPYTTSISISESRGHKTRSRRTNQHTRRNRPDQIAHRPAPTSHEVSISWSTVKNGATPSPSDCPTRKHNSISSPDIRPSPPYTTISYHPIRTTLPPGQTPSLEAAAAQHSDNSCTTLCTSPRCCERTR